MNERQTAVAGGCCPLTTDQAFAGGTWTTDLVTIDVTAGKQRPDR